LEKILIFTLNPMRGKPNVKHMIISNKELPLEKLENYQQLTS
jgi:hypothetical protein